MSTLKAKIEFKHTKNFDSLKAEKGSLLVLGLGRENKTLKLSSKVKIASKLKPLLSTLSTRKDFKGAFGNSRTMMHHGVELDPFEGFEHLQIVGCGSSKDYHSQNLLKLGGKIAQAIAAYRIENADIYLDCFLNAASSKGAANAPKDFAGRSLLAGPLAADECLEKLALGVFLGLYRFESYKSSKKEKSTLPRVRFFSQHIVQAKGTKVISRAETLASAVGLTRDLQTIPSNDLTPALLGKAAQEAGRTFGFKTQIFDEKKLKSMKMNGILAVGQGSSNPPRLIVMEYNPSGKKSKPLVLVGKGVTFDTGGTSLKPAPGMEEMKMDMSGAASVIGTIAALAKLKVKRRVIALVPSAENRLSSTSINPGDIYTAYNGKTVEVLNTDAEGRLILGDALSYAAEFKPECVVDVATLTGAVVIALGGECSGVMGNNHKVIRGFQSASEKAGEKTWELPLFNEYAEDMKSPVADYKNIGSSRSAGSSKAGCFLNFFVDKKYPWVHVDIAGSADNPSAQGAHCPPHVGTGVPVRSLVEFFENYSGYVK